MVKKKKKISNVDALSLICSNIENLVTVSNMEEEKFYPTMFTSYNRATGIGGHPIRRVTTIHGPNSTGKSVLAAALAESARQSKMIPVIFEAEWSAEKKWLNNLVGGDGVGLKMPGSLDELFEDVQKMLENLENAKKEGKLDDEVGICFVIDTLTKLIPQEQLDTLVKEGIKKSFPLQAMWISIWTKIIIPQAYRSNSTFILVLQDRKNIGASKFQKQRKQTLGEALLYDASLNIECTHAKHVKSKDKVVATQLHYKLEKNKSDGFTAQEGSFFISTGQDGGGVGLDLEREAIEEGLFRGVLKKVKRDNRSCFIAEFDGEELFAIDGGTVNIRKRFLEDRKLFDLYVAKLNESSSRKN